MFFYFFDRHYGHDRVAQARIEWASAWDFFEARWYGYILCLWEHVSRVEQYTKTVELWLEKAEIITLCNWLLSQQSIDLMHWFTHHRFCSYKKALPLRISDPEDIAKRMILKKSKKSTNSQKLTIYPNLWSLHNDNDINKINSTTIILHSQSTKKQKSDAFWSIKNGLTESVVCTYSQMFQDRTNLQKITLIDQHTWYYKSQQDPRYKTWTVIDQMWEIYGCEIIKSWYSLV